MGYTMTVIVEKLVDSKWKAWPEGTEVMQDIEWTDARGALTRWMGGRQERHPLSLDTTPGLPLDMDEESFIWYDDSDKENKYPYISKPDAELPYDDDFPQWLLLSQWIEHRTWPTVDLLSEGLHVKIEKLLSISNNPKDVRIIYWFEY